MRVEHGCREGIVLAEGINPFYSDLDAYPMMASVIDEAVRRAISVGGAPDRIAGWTTSAGPIRLFRGRHRTDITGWRSSCAQIKPYTT